MAKRFKDTELWDKEWFMALEPRLKCLVQLVRDKCDLSGVWSPNWTLAKNYVGEKVNEQDLLGIDGGNQFIKTDGGKIFCLGFIQFQYGELSEKSPVHRKIINLLATHKIDYKHPINRVQEKEEDKEEEEVMEVEEVKEEEIEAKIPFENFWKLYDKKVGDMQKLIKKWDKLTIQEQQDVIQYIPIYKESTPDKAYRKNPETFLNNKSWNDEIIKSNGKPSKIDTIITGGQAIDRAIDDGLLRGIK